MGAPRILLVDDQRQVIRMLRSSLEFSGRDYTVVDVPSGEEALLELARSRIDVLVTDLRLPGISGLELLGRARQLNPEARAILLTGQPTEEIQYQAEALGVVAFLRKPLTTGTFLEAVEKAVEESGIFGSPVEVLEEEKPELSELLDGLRLSLDARAALLLDLAGEVVVTAGDLSPLDLGPVLPSLTATFSASLTASTLLGTLLPVNLQQIDGDSEQLYLINIGAYYGLLVVCDGRPKEGQLEAVRRRGEAAANDLLAALSRMGMGELATSPPTPSPPAVESAAAEEPVPVAKEARGAAERRDVGAGEVSPEAAEEFWDEAAKKEKAPSGNTGKLMPYDEARRRGILKKPPS